MSRWDALRSAFKDRRGSSTVEFVVWIPFFLAMLAIFTDVALILNTRARMVNAATEAAIAYAVYHKTEAESVQVAKAFFKDLEMEASVTPDGSGNLVTAELTANFSDIMLFTGGFFVSGSLVGETVLTATMRRIVEPEAETEE